MTRTALTHTRRGARYLAVAATAVSLLALHVSGAAAFNPQPDPPGGPRGDQVAIAWGGPTAPTTNISWGGGVGDLRTGALGQVVPQDNPAYAPANDPS